MRILQNIVKYALALFWLFVTGFPFAFIFLSSMKGMMEYFTTSVWALPQQFQFGNYVQVIQAGFHSYFLNSLIVTFVDVFIVAMSASMAANVIARFMFKFGKWVYTLFLAGMMIPIHVTLIPVYNMTRHLGLYDSLAGLVGPYVAYSLPVSIFIFVGFIQDVPVELEEAALVDGANRYQIYWHVILPVIKPAISTVVIYNMVMLWNEFIYALVLLSSPSKWILTLGLWNFRGEYGIHFPLVMAGLVLSVLPLIIAYVFFHEQIIKGMTAGSVKG